MNISTLTTLSVLLCTTSVFAADPVTSTGAYIYDWSGFHIGLGGGRAAAVTQLDSIKGLSSDGIFGEASVGYDHVFDNGLVLGGIITGHFGNQTASITSMNLTADVKTRYGFDAVARLGHAVTPSTLAYVLGGYSWRNFQVFNTGMQIGDVNRNGYVVGLGTETVLRNNWTLRSEYRYADYADFSLAGSGTGEYSPSVHSFHTVLSYRLNGGQSDRMATPVNYDWNGLKVGGAFGAGVVGQKINETTVPATIIDRLGNGGVFGEFNIGYDRVIHDKWVAGAVLAGRYSHISFDEITMFGTTTTSKPDYGFDALLRVGRMVGSSSLAYVIGGYSWQHVSVDVAMAGLSDDSANGYTIGTGLEVALSDKITGYTEYRYSHYGDMDFGDPNVTAETTSHTVRAGFKVKLY